MARVNVYLPDELAVAAKAAGLNVSQVVQEALARVLAGRRTDAWLDELRPPTPRPADHSAVLHALDEARGQAPTRHG